MEKNMKVNFEDVVCIENVTEENSIYVAYNLHQSEHEFGLPILQKGKEWKLIFSTEDGIDNFTPDGVEIPNQRILNLSGRSICVLEGK